MIAVRTFFMGKPLEENASPKKAEQEFVIVCHYHHYAKCFGG